MSNEVAAKQYRIRAAELAASAANVVDPDASAELTKRAKEHAKAADNLSGSAQSIL